LDGLVTTAAVEPSGFVVNLEGFEGPLDLLLDLARRDKVDLGRISILRLAEQYLDYLARLRARDLPVAAEYLVMAAWLAYLKSQLLLPAVERELPDAETRAGDLEARVRQLDAVRRGAASLQERPRLGIERFARGANEVAPVQHEVRYRVELGELLAAYGRLAHRGRVVRLTFPSRKLDSPEAALQRLRHLLAGHDWRDLMSFLPPELAYGLQRRSAVAASFVASLELARSGAIDLRQLSPFGPLLVRRR
jgi:segregation and condensation protein A